MKRFVLVKVVLAGCSTRCRYKKYNRRGRVRERKTERNRQRDLEAEWKKVSCNTERDGWKGNLNRSFNSWRHSWKWANPGIFKFFSSTIPLESNSGHLDICWCLPTTHWPFLFPLIFRDLPFNPSLLLCHLSLHLSGFHFSSFSLISFSLPLSWFVSSPFSSSSFFYSLLFLLFLLVSIFALLQRFSFSSFSKTWKVQP